MKKLVLILALMLAAMLCSCSKLKKELPILGVLSATDNAYINLGELESPLQYTTRFLTLADNNEASAIEQLAESKPFAIVVCGNANMKNLIEKAKEFNIPLLFVATKPDINALEGYDKAWSFTANPMQGGELLGARLGKAFKDTTIADQNLDDILQCLEISANNATAIASAIQSAADLGVFSTEDKITAQTREDAKNSFLELYADKMPPELILCENETLALGASDALEQLKKSAPIAYIHDEITSLKLVSDNFYSAALFPSSDMLATANAFIQNILSSEAVNQNTDYRLDKNKIVYFVYSLA